MKRTDLPVRNQSRSSGAPRIVTLLLATLLSCIGTKAFAYDFTAVNDDGVTIYYNYINDDKEAEVTDNYGNYYSGDVTIPATVTVNGTTLNVTRIYNDAFNGCESLTSVTIPNSVTSIGMNAFNDCSSLASVTIGNSVTSIGYGAFSGCSNLTEVTLQGTTLPTTCATNAFDNISSNATLYCAPVLGTACSETEPWKSKFNTIDASVVTLASGERLSAYITDDNKSTVTKLKIYGEINSEDVATMKDMAKNGALSVLDISGATAATADLIGSNAFYKCSKLTSISLPYGITSIGEWAFTYCSSLTGITIPNSVKNIGKNAFHYCSSLTDITIPNSVTSIDEGVFLYCTSLTSITIPNSVTSIGEGAFMNCSKLTSITIPNSVTNIDNGAFCECTSLASATIGSSVTNIGEWAFGYCTGLTEVTLRGKTLPTCATNAFDNISSNATLYCKTALLEKCKVTEPWKNFKYIVAKPFSITISDAGIATGCFDDDLDFSEVTGVKAYIASGFNPATGKVLMTNVTEVPAGTGFLVKGTEGTYEIPAAATKYMYANLLVGTLEETTVAQTEDTYTNYVLGKDNTTNEVGFYLADGTAVPANKAYLQLPTSAVTTDETSEAKTSLRLSFDDMDDTTGITQIREQSDSANGKTVIYNLNGQRKQSLTKGLNIVNGKKIFVK